MNEKLELYKHIYKDSEMGIFTITKLLEELKEKDNKIKKDVEEILKGYERYFSEAKDVLGDCTKDENGMMAKMGASMGIRKEVKSDNSDASIAEMLIQGVSMGTIEMEKKIKDYKDEVDKKEIKFAKDFLEFQQDVITGLKKYL